MQFLQGISGFIGAGGWVLEAIAVLTLIMWTLIFERLWFFQLGLGQELGQLQQQWQDRREHKSWAAHQVRRMLISQARLSIDSNMALIKTLVALCPLFGLLGTVWGMIEVFNIMAVTGGGDARSMASGVSQATIPTMAGMVAALSGVFANTYLCRIAQNKSHHFEQGLALDS